MAAGKGEIMTCAYLARNLTLRQGYIGIGPLTRAGGGHTRAVNALLSHPDTTLEVLEGFSSRTDAKLAESLAIAVANAGDADFKWLNISESVGSSALVPLLPQRPGRLLYSDLRETMIAVITPEKIDSVRGTVTAATPIQELADRLLQYWPTGTAIAREYPITRFIAVSKASHNIVPRVLGDWDTLAPAQWARAGRVGVVDGLRSDARGTVGMIFDWSGVRPGRQISYSGDIRHLLAAS